MRIFMCDVCGEPFKHVRGSINNIEFYIEPVNIKQWPRLACWNEGKLPKPYEDGRGTATASYHICQKCFDVIRDTLIDLRNTGAGDPPSDSQE